MRYWEIFEVKNLSLSFDDIVMAKLSLKTTFENNFEIKMYFQTEDVVEILEFLKKFVEKSKTIKMEYENYIASINLDSQEKMILKKEINDEYQRVIAEMSKFTNIKKLKKL